MKHRTRAQRRRDDEALERTTLFVVACMVLALGGGLLTAAFRGPGAPVWEWLVSGAFALAGLLLALVALFGAGPTVTRWFEGTDVFGLLALLVSYPIHRHRRRR